MFPFWNRRCKTRRNTLRLLLQLRRPASTPTPQSPPPAPHYWSYLERIRCQDNVFLHKRSNYVMKFLNGNPRLCALRCSPVPKVRAFNCMRTTVKPPLWTILNVESDASKKHAGKLFLAFFHCADKKRLVFHPHVVHGAAQSGFQTSGTITAIITLTSLSPLPAPEIFKTISSVLHGCHS